MSIVSRTRTLRSTTRFDTSPYKVDVKGVSSSDTLVLTILAEDQERRLIAQFEFSGSALARRSSIHFNALRRDARWRISFIGVQPAVVMLPQLPTFHRGG